MCKRQRERERERRGDEETHATKGGGDCTRTAAEVLVGLLAAVVGNDDAALVRRLRVRSLLVRRLCIHNLCEKREKGERERERAMRESDGVFLP